VENLSAIWLCEAKKDEEMTVILDKVNEEAYLGLVRSFALMSIEDDARLTAALAVIDRLVKRLTRSVAEDVYLAAVTDLVEPYENAHVALPPVTGVEPLRYLMEETGLTQADLAPLFGALSIMSEVLSGTWRLVAHFGLPVSVLIDA
jgi:HTH-type transcriptional regulator/antitoxin HigA